MQTQPATGITHAMASSYCKYKERRLPTVNEWLYAARGHLDERIYPWGDEPPKTGEKIRANFGRSDTRRPAPDRADTHYYAAPVKTFSKVQSPWGAANLAGNVREWTFDRAGQYAQVVGGGWRDKPTNLRVTRTQAVKTNVAVNDLGFRCATDANVEEKMTQIIEQLMTKWTEAREGDGAIVHITGSVGCGKSAALDQFLEHARKEEEGAVIVSARCGDRTLIRSSDHGELEDLVARIAEGVRVIEVDAEAESNDESSQAVQWLLPGVDFLVAATRLSSLPAIDNNNAGPSRARIYADLLLDIAREHPILLILDDIHRTDAASKDLLDSIGAALEQNRPARLMLVAASTNLVEHDGVTHSMWTPASGVTLDYNGLDNDEIRALVHRRLEPHFGEGAEIIQAILRKVGQNPLFAHALVGLVERAVVAGDGLSENVSLESLELAPEWQGLSSLCDGQWPVVRADVLADLRSAAVVGERFTPHIMADLWSVPLEAALIRTDALCATGLITAQGDELVFLSRDAYQLADEVPYEPRQELHAHIATILRGRSRRQNFVMDTTSTVLDVTETWRETFRRDRNIKDELDALWAAAYHFGSARRHTSAAEAAVTLVECLFESSGGQPYLAGRFGRRADRERRHRIYAALTEASSQLELAEKSMDDAHGDELVGIRIRLLTVRSRFGGDG